MDIRRSHLNSYSSWKDEIQHCGYNNRVVKGLYKSPSSEILIAEIKDNKVNLVIEYGTTSETPPLITYYKGDKIIEINRDCPSKLSKYLPHGKILSEKFLPLKDYPLGYKILNNQTSFFKLSQINEIECFVPLNSPELIVYGPSCKNLPLGKRWYVVEKRSEKYGDFFQHRCNRKIKTTKFFSTECSACGEDVTKVVDNLSEKIEAARAASSFKRAIKC